MILDNLNETRDLLLDIHKENVNSYLCNEAGFLYRFYEFNEETDLNNITLSQTEMESLGSDRIVSLYEYGFHINGSDSERVRASKEFICIECSEDPDSIVSAFKSCMPKLSKNRLNIIIVFFTDAMSAVYNTDLHRIADEFDTHTLDYDKKIYTFDLVNDVLRDRYAIKCLGNESYKDLSKVYHPVNNDMDLLELESKIIPGGKYIITSDLSSKFIDKDIWILSYVALRKKAVFLFEDSSFDNTYTLVCQKLFSHEWGMLSDIIKHLSSLEGKNFIVQTDSRKFKPCTVMKVEKSFEFSVIALKDIFNNTSDCILRHTVKKKNVIVTASDVMDSSSVMSQLWASCGKDISTFLKQLRRIQLLCLYTLTDRLIGINQVCWIVNNGEIYFGVPSIGFSDVEVRIYTGNDNRDISIDQARLLPVGLFADEFFGAVLEGAGESSIKQLTYEALVNIQRARSEGNKYFTVYMSEGKINEAFTLLNYAVSDEDNDLYRRCLQIFGREFCDKLSIELDGKIECYVNLSPIL